MEVALESAIVVAGVATGALKVAILVYILAPLIVSVVDTRTYRASAADTSGI